jgi:hypothetical protein
MIQKTLHVPLTMHLPQSRRRWFEQGRSVVVGRLNEKMYWHATKCDGRVNMQLTLVNVMYSGMSL